MGFAAPDLTCAGGQKGVVTWEVEGWIELDWSLQTLGIGLRQRWQQRWGHCWGWGCSGSCEGGFRMLQDLCWERRRVGSAWGAAQLGFGGALRVPESLGGAQGMLPVCSRHWGVDRGEPEGVHPRFPHPGAEGSRGPTRPA